MWPRGVVRPHGFVGEPHPSKQGLKQGTGSGKAQHFTGRRAPSIKTRIETGSFPRRFPAAFCRRAPSIKTRIETYLLSAINECLFQVGEPHPSKQGLKRFLFETSTDFAFWVGEPHPSKQGLKHVEFVSTREQILPVGEPHPSKQGLKL